MECLADCGEGPVVMVGDQTFENIVELREKMGDLLLKINLKIPRNMSATRTRQNLLRHQNPRISHQQKIAQRTKDYFKECYDPCIRTKFRATKAGGYEMLKQSLKKTRRILVRKF